MYQALYRKWRPKTFDEVIGQPHITETLKNQVRSGKLSHAYIFIGTRGTGKTTCARILAKAVNCENPENGNPCCKCPSCLSIADGSAVDVVELDAASNNGVDNVRALREEAIFSPTTVKKRVYIIDEVHMLSTSAFNALLKIVEEPPEHLMFILATTELQKVPATILSRCQRHSFRRIEASILAEYLKNISARENVSITDDAASLIARLSDGGVRDSLSLLDQCAGQGNIDTDIVYNTLGLAGNKRTAKLLNRIITHNTNAAIEDFNSMWMDGKDPSGILNELCSLLRDTLLMKAAPLGGESLTSNIFDSETVAYFVKRMTPEEITAAMEKLQRTLADMKLSPNTKMTAEVCIISLCSSVMGDTVSDLRARISRLEKALAEGQTVSRAIYPEPEYEPPVQQYEPHVYDEPTVPEAQYPPAEHPIPEPEPVVYRTETTKTPPVREKVQDELVYKGGTEKDDGAAAEAFPAANTGAGWAEISEALRTALGMPAAMIVQDPASVRGTLRGSELTVEVIAGFYLATFQREENIACIRKTAHDICGRDILVKVIEMRKETRTAHSLEELKKFSEVHFNN